MNDLSRCNDLLAGLSIDELDKLERILETIDVSEGETLYRFGDRLDHVVFPETCLISIVATSGKTAAIECALVGQEGVAGGYVLLGVDYAVTSARVRVPGRATRITAESLRQVLQRNSGLRDRIGRWVALLTATIHQSVACNALHDVEARMCRWLLELGDRTDAPRIPLKQETLAQMLGVRRTTVTSIAYQLQQSGALSWRRGFVTIGRRELLTQRSCNCYACVRQIADRLGIRRRIYHSAPSVGAKAAVASLS
jgi:CRP-like cAMP-binding protein